MGQLALLRAYFLDTCVSSNFIWIVFHLKNLSPLRNLGFFTLSVSLLLQRFSVTITIRCFKKYSWVSFDSFSFFTLYQGEPIYESVWNTAIYKLYFFLRLTEWKPQAVQNFTSPRFFYKHTPPLQIQKISILKWFKHVCCIAYYSRPWLLILYDG